MRTMKIGGEKRLLTVSHRNRPCRTSLRCSRSCPNLIPRAKVYVPLRHFSPCKTKPVCDKAKNPPSFVGCSGKSAANIAGTIAAACKCPCPFPCGPCGNCCGCNCLPPPCNTPPKCIQYMTGYYYYPYGFWFCGPYHVSGCCCPVGPCCGGPCGPCAKCCLVPGALTSSLATATLATTLKDSPKKDMNQQMPQKPIMPQSPQITQSPFPYPQMPQVPFPQQSPQYPWQVPGASPFNPQQCVKAPQDESAAISKFFPFSTTAVPGQACGSSPLDKPSTLSNKAQPGAKATRSCPGTNARSYNTNSSQEEQSSPPEVHDAPYKFCAALPKQAGAESCPPQLYPRHMPTAQERDRPAIRPGAFDINSVPKYRNPYPEPVDFKFKHKENKM